MFCSFLVSGKNIILYFVVDGLTVLTFQTAQTTIAHQRYQAKIPNGNNVQDWPAVGHVSAKANPNGRNSFGKDFSAAGNTWTINLCKMDSDNDGQTNGQELGDPDCVWNPGATPFRVTGITNPGIFNNFLTGNISSTMSPTLASADDKTSNNNNSSDAMTSVESWKVAHAIFMALSFGLILPLSTIIPFFCRAARSQGRWREDHIKLMYLSNSMAVIGFLIAIFSVGVQPTLHGILGVTLLVIVMLQSTFGYFRRKLPTSFQWRKVHSIIGRGLLLLVAFQVFSGYVELNEDVPFIAIIIGIVHFGFLITVFIITGRAFRKRLAEQGGEGLTDEPAEEPNFAPLDSVTHAHGLELS